jgi:hypothetical protein
LKSLFTYLAALTSRIAGSTTSIAEGRHKRCENIQHQHNRQGGGNADRFLIPVIHRMPKGSDGFWQFS